MRLARHGRFVGAAAAGILITACTSIGPAPSTSVPVLPSVAVPSVALPSVALPSIELSPAPTFADIPTPPPTHSSKTPKPSKSAGPSGPNLIITKFVTDSDPFLVVAHTDGKVTVKNTGTEDAATFDVGVSFAANGGGGAFSPVIVDGVAAGDSVQVTVNLTQTDPGDYVFTAQADSDDAIVESNEDDNTKTLSVTALSLPNLAWGPDGFKVVPDQAGNGKYEFDMDLANTGTADVSDQFEIGFHYYVDPAGSGTLDPFQCCTTEGGPVIPAGSSRTQGLSGISLDAGHYVIYATLDSEEKIDESNEDDNEAQSTIDVP